MNLRQRFKFYLLGVLAGSLFVLFVFGRRTSCQNYVQNYLPNGRVLSEIETLQFTYKPSALEHLSVLGIDTADFRENIFFDGEIDFDVSEPRKKPCGFYKMQSIYEENSYRILFDKCKTTVEVLSVVKE